MGRIITLKRTPERASNSIKEELLRMIPKEGIGVDALIKGASLPAEIAWYAIKRHRPWFWYDAKGKAIFAAKKDEFRVSQIRGEPSWVLVHNIKKWAEIQFPCHVPERTQKDLSAVLFRKIIDADIPPVTEKEWYSFHECCPRCGANGDESSPTILSIGTQILEDFEDDINEAGCRCGWRGKVNERVPDIDGKWFGIS